MKITGYKKEEVFTPLTINILIENKIELRAIYRLSRYNLTIPKVVGDGDDEIADTVQEFLRQLREALRANSKTS